YDFTKRRDRTGQVGEGSTKGVIAAETANNAVTGGALIPLLTLGVPGDGATAIMLGALMMHDLRPGPTLFSQHGDLVLAVYLALLVGNVAMLLLGLTGARLFAQVLRMRTVTLIPFVTILCIVGSYSARNSI